MKKENYLIILLLIFTSLSACKKDDLTYVDDFEKSHKAWNNFKTTANNSYSYTVETSSWTGTSTTTVLTIAKGKVVKRSYVARLRDYATNQVTILEEWTEEGATLHTHQQGDAIITLDEVYQKARTEWLLTRVNAKTYFEANNGGLISSAGYVENNCQDDCFVGIKISSIQKL